MRIVLNKRSSDRLNARLVKKMRVRKKLSGDAARPRLSVFKSAKHIYAQIIDDSKGATLVSTSSLKLKERLSGKDQAKRVGSELASIAKQKDIGQVVFDRNGFRYHGRIKALADGAREAGLKF
jgi:large subunit ribosomal protein L18